MKRKILLIDDSATARALFKACMRGNDQYDVLESASAEQAMTIAKNENPFLIIFDYNMPNKNGAEIARDMKMQGINAYFALMSANTQNAIVNEVNELGFVAIIEKPVTIEAVQSLLEKLS